MWVVIQSGVLTMGSYYDATTRSIFYKKQRKIQTSHVSYFFEIFDGFCFLEIEKSCFFVSENKEVFEGLFLIFFKCLLLFLKFEGIKLKHSILHTFLHTAIHFSSAHYDFLKNYLLQEHIPSNFLLSMPLCFLGHILWLVSIRNMFLRYSRALVFCFLFFSKKELVFLITVSYNTYCVYAFISKKNERSFIKKLSVNC